MKVSMRIFESCFESIASFLVEKRRIPQVSAKNANRRNLTLRILFLRPLARAEILCLAILSSLFGLASPWFQKEFIDVVLSSGGSGGSGNGAPLYHHFTNSPYAAILLAFIALVLSQALNLAMKLVAARESIIVQNHISQDFYNHALRLTYDARTSRTIGDQVNLFVQDTAAGVSLIEECLGAAVAAFVPLFAAPIFIHVMFGIPTMAIIWVTLFQLCLLALLSWRQSGFFGAFKRLASERLAIVNEWLQNIRIIRILGWTEFFEEKIITKRRAETRNRLVMVSNGSAMNALAQTTPMIMNVVGVTVLVAAKPNAISPGEVFALLWVFGVFLARPLRAIPWSLVWYIDGRTSCRRLEAFFKLPIESPPHENTQLHHAEPRDSNSNQPGKTLTVQNLNLILNERQILKNIDFTATAGKLIVITGDVGAGKTQFLLSLLCENGATFDRYLIDNLDMKDISLQNLRRQFALVPQDGFVMSASLRENVQFSYIEAAPSLDTQTLVSNVLAQAAFDPSTETLSDGINSEIGERGVNLSGGQRQRVALARAAFHERSIVLLDDSFSAVDAGTEEILVRELLCGAWLRKTRILVSHRLSVVTSADEVWDIRDGSLYKASKKGGDSK